MCSKCLTPWTLGKFNLDMRSSNAKRTARRNYRIERLQLQMKSKQSSATKCKAINKRIKRLQQQNNHVAVNNANLCFNHRKSYKMTVCLLQIYKCFCSKKARTKVQLRKQKQNNKHNKSENVTSGTIMSEKIKQHEHDSSNPRKEEVTTTTKKKKRNKTAGLLIPLSKKNNATALASNNNRNLSKISEMFRQQKTIDETTKQQSKLNQFFK